MHRPQIATAGKSAGVALLFAFGAGAAMPGFALDCAKVKQPVEKRICANASLRAADAKMRAAYAAILKAAPDVQIRAMLARSQRRWVQARNKELASDFDNEPLSVAAVRTAVDERTHDLADRSDQGFIAHAQVIRQWLAQNTDGSLTGFAPDCWFLPEDARGTAASYACMGTINVQRRARVCSWTLYWASGRFYDNYGMSSVKDGKVKRIAYCDGNENDCTGTGGQGSAPEGWVRFDADAPIDDDAFPLPVAGLIKLDAEVGETWWPQNADDDLTHFFKRCLADPQYPPGLQ